MSQEFVARNGIISQNNIVVSRSVKSNTLVVGAGSTAPDVLYNFNITKTKSGL